MDKFPTNITITDIQNISDHCIKILSSTEYLRRDEATKEAYTFAEDIFKSIRKLVIASMMYNKKLICIAGTQGAGKTSLMKKFYDLDDTYFQPTLGRGERIPVFITEKNDISVPVMHGIKIVQEANGKYSQQEVELSPDDYLSASRGEDPNTMYLELCVPYKHTNNEGVSFVLLPGYEKDMYDSERKYWNNLIDFSVNSSDAAVWVVDSAKFSNHHNAEVLDKIKNDFGTNLIYAASWSDSALNDNEDFKQNFLNTLDIPASESDRVVCVGQYEDEQKNENWIHTFKDALEKYAYREMQQMQKNSKYIYNEMLTIKEKLYAILTVLENNSSTEINDFQNNALLKEFDKAARKKREEFEKYLEEEFEKAKSESGKILEKRFEEIPKMQTLKRFFFGSSVKEQFTQTREMVQASLVYDDNMYLPDKYLGQALKRSLIALESESNRTDLSRLVDTRKDGNKTLLLVNGEKTQALVNDVKNLLADNSSANKIYTLKCTRPKKVLNAVVEMGTYFYSLQSYDRLAEFTDLAYYEPAKTQLTGEKVLAGAQSSKKFVVGMAGMMGIDLIGDGTINIVSQIASSLGISVPVAGALAITVVGAGAASVVLQDLNRIQRDDFQSARFAVNGIYDNLKIDALKKYDAYMEKIRDRIEDNIANLNGRGKTVISEYNAKVEVNNTLDLLDDLSNEYVGVVHGQLATAFS